ncbi:MAG: hypothetical protein IPJ46_04265 [Anaerolineales bacterium]|nr:hypothetical protein [Anaerolineales bacterium]
MTDFNQVPNRRKSSNSIKWQYYPKDVLPMWVADMEFPAPRPILRALHKAVDHGVLGHELPSNALKETVASRMDKLYGWKVKPEAVVTVTELSAVLALQRIACTTQKVCSYKHPSIMNFMK